MTERLAERPVGGEGWREDRRVLLNTAAVGSGAFALGSVAQAAYIYAAVAPGWSAVDVWSRVLANMLAVAGLLGTLLVWRQHRRARPADRWLGIVLAALACAVLRVVVQVPLGVYRGYAGTTTALPGLSTSLVNGGSYTILAYPGSGGTTQFTVLSNTNTPASGQAGLRIFNASGSGPFDVYTAASGGSFVTPSATMTCRPIL